MHVILLTLLTVLMAFSPNLSAEIKVVALAGSLRTDSVNKKLIREAAAIAKELGANVTLIDLKDYPLPLYDADIEESPGMPENGKQLRKLLKETQVIMISSPEYNASVPGNLKNFIDWMSRKEDKGPSRDAFKGKKVLLMSASPSSLGGTRALADLRPIIDDIGGNGTVLPIQLSIPDAYNAFDAEGHLKNPQQKDQLRRLVQSAVQ